MPGSSAVLPSRFRYRLSPVNMRRGLWVALGALAALFVLAELVSGDLFAEILQGVQKQPIWVLALALGGTVALIVLIGRIVSMAKEAWLLVDSDGIRCSPHPHHGPRTWLRHDWQVSWSAVERAIVRRPGPKAQHVQNWINTTLILETSQGRHDLALLHWDPVDDPLERPDLLTMRPGRQLYELTETHPLVRHLEQRDIDVEFDALGVRGRLGMDKPAADRPDAGDDGGPVDIMAFGWLVIMLSVMGLLGVAAAAHFTVMPSIRALWPPPYGLLALAGSAVFVLGALLSRSAPVRERTIIALLLGTTVGALAHPLSVRLHSMTGDDPVTVDYIVEAPGIFHPVDANHPVLDLSDLNIPEYWNSLSAGAMHPFELQTVDEDRYVLRLDPLFERTRAHYSE